MNTLRKPQVSASFYLSLLEFLMSAKQHMVALGNKFDLTSIQTITLLLIDPNHARPMKTFCSLFHCDASNVTGIVDGLEQKGLVSRQNDQSDRRIKVVQLEPEGKALQQAIIEQLATDNGFLFDGLSADEAEQFVNIVRKLAAQKTSA